LAGLFLCVWLDLSRDFLGVFKTISRFLVHRVISCNPFWKFLRPGNSAWDFFFFFWGGVIFGPGFFWGFVGSPRDFFGF